MKTKDAKHGAATRCHHRQRAAQAGAAAVEMAILLPLLLVILFGIIEFSLLLFDKAMITNASREGARLGIVYRHPELNDAELEAEIVPIVNAYCASHLISFQPGTSPVTSVQRVGSSSTATSEAGTVTVTVSYPYDFLVFPGLVAGPPGR